MARRGLGARGRRRLMVQSSARGPGGDENQRNVILLLRPAVLSEGLFADPQQKALPVSQGITQQRKHRCGIERSSGGTRISDSIRVQQ